MLHTSQGETIYEARLTPEIISPILCLFQYILGEKHTWRNWNTNEEQLKRRQLPLEFGAYSRTSIPSHQTLWSLHFASRYSMTQLLKDKQSMKGKKREEKMSSWESLAKRALTSAQLTSTHFSIFTTGIWVIPGTQTSKLWPLLIFLLRKILQKFHSCLCPLFFHTQELLLSALLMLHLKLQRLKQE